MDAFTNSWMTGSTRQFSVTTSDQKMVHLGLQQSNAQPDNPGLHSTTTLSINITHHYKSSITAFQKNSYNLSDIALKCIIINYNYGAKKMNYNVS